MVQVMSEEVTAITELTAAEIVAAVQDGRYTPLQVLQAFQCKVRTRDIVSAFVLELVMAIRQ